MAFPIHCHNNNNYQSVYLPLFIKYVKQIVNDKFAVLIMQHVLYWPKLSKILQALSVKTAHESLTFL